jgi:hypothetical protein
LLRLVVFDRTDTAPVVLQRSERLPDGTARGVGGLTRFWRAGAVMHRAAGRASATLGASSFREALGWAAACANARGERIAELQAWGHGGWGYMGMGSDRLDAETIARGGALAREVDAFKEALAPGALVWLRCCSAFGAASGRAFAARLADRLGARVAGHTFIIGVWQSGAHSVAPGADPAWDPNEGLDLDPATRSPRGALESSRRAPQTLHCLRLGFPPGF